MQTKPLKNLHGFIRHPESWSLKELILIKHTCTFTNNLTWKMYMSPACVHSVPYTGFTQTCDSMGTERKCGNESRHGTLDSSYHQLLWTPSSSTKDTNFGGLRTNNHGTPEILHRRKAWMFCGEDRGPFCILNRNTISKASELWVILVTYWLCK